MRKILYLGIGLIVFGLGGISSFSSAGEVYSESINHQFTNTGGYQPFSKSYSNLSDFAEYGDRIFFRQDMYIGSYNKVTNTIRTSIVGADFDSTLYSLLGVKNNIIYYAEGSSFSFYKYDISSGIKTQLSTGFSSQINQDDMAVGSDGNYIYFANPDDNSYLYQLPTDGSASGGHGNLISSNDFVGVEVGSNYLYGVQNGNGTYRYNMDGTNETKILNKDATHLKVDDGYLYYYGEPINNSYYYRNNTDGTNEITLTSSTTDYGKIEAISPNNDYIIYNSSSDIYKAVKTDGSDSGGVGTEVGFLNGDMIFGSEGNFAYFSKEIDWSHYFYKVPSDMWLNNYSNYNFSDDIYKKINVNLGNVTSKIKINVDDNIPSGTDYKFHLSNNISSTEVIASGDRNIYLTNDKMKYYCPDCMTTVDYSTEVNNNLSTGDSVVLFKDGTELRTKISGIDDNYLYFEDYFSESSSSWGIRKVNMNYSIIDKSKLDGSTEINFSDYFSVTDTDTISYKIDLRGDGTDRSKTPIVNSVSISSSAGDKETVTDSDGNIITEFDKTITNMKQEAVDRFRRISTSLHTIRSENQKRNYVKRKVDRQQFNSMVKGYMSILNEALQSDSATKCNNLSPFGTSQVERCKELVNY